MRGSDVERPEAASQAVDANGTDTPAAGDGTTTYSYDRAGHLTLTDYSDAAPDVIYAGPSRVSTTRQDHVFDDDSRIVAVTSGGAATSYAYDPAANMGRLELSLFG